MRFLDTLNKPEDDSTHYSALTHLDAHYVLQNHGSPIAPGQLVERENIFEFVREQVTGVEPVDQEVTSLC